jgi:hypothetical protein
VCFRELIPIFWMAREPIGGDLIFNPSAQIIADNVQDFRAAVTGRTALHLCDTTRV